MQNFEKLGYNRGRSYQIFISNKLDLTFRTPNHCGNFIKIESKLRP